LKIWAVGLLFIAVSVVGAAPSSSRWIRIPVRAAGDFPSVETIQATLDRSEARIARVLTPADPQMLLLVLDMVGDLAAVEPAKEALISEIQKLPVETYVGVLRAQDGLSVLVDPTPDRTAVIDAIRGLTISGRPGLLEAMDAVERLADSIGRKAQVRVSVLHVSDSDVREYREDFTNPVINSSDPHDLSRRFPEALIKEKMSKFNNLFAAYETPLHIVHLAYRPDRLNEAYRNGLQQLASDTAGSSVFCRSRAEIGQAIESAFRTVNSEAAVLLKMPERIAETVQVKITAGDVPLVHRSRLKIKEK
jgi:hypothetical protein